MHADSDDSLQLDEICDEFEHEWREGRIPDIADWCRMVDPVIQPALRCRLIAIDSRHRLQAQLTEVTRLDHAVCSDVSLDTKNKTIVPEAESSEPTPQTTTWQQIPPDAELSPREEQPSCGYRLSQPEQTSPVPDSIGGCRILQEIARGGMGIVYKAWQPGVNRTVAVKLLYPSANGGTSIRQFQAEAAAAGRLQHSGIVRVYSAGEENSTRYLIMEFIDGPNLEQFIGDQLLSGKRTARIVREIADAIASIHDNGVIHRDIKPANILIDEDEHPRIADFGLARLEDSGLSMTATGMIVGTPSYMSPEQARGDVRSLTASIDIYSLGAIIYRCLTGRPPFSAPRRLEVLEQILNQEPIPVHQLNRDVEPDLETICLRCLQKDPADRPLTAKFLAEELSRFLNDEPIHLRPLSAYQRTLRWCRRHPQTAMVRAALAALLLLVLSGIPMLRWQAGLIAIAEQQQLLGEKTIREGILREELEKQRADQAEETAKEHAHNAEVQKYYATVMEAGEVRAAQEAGWTWKLINLVQRAADTRLDKIDPVRLRSLAVDALTSIDVLKVQTFCELRHIDIMGISPDGATLALPEVLGVPSANVHLFSIAPTNSLEPETLFQVSPSRLLSMNTIYDKETSSHAATSLTNATNPGFRSVAFSEDGRFCATGTRSGALTMWDLSLATPTQVYEKEFAQQNLAQILFSPNGRFLHVRHIDGRCLRTLDRATGAELASRFGDVWGMAILPNGRLLLAEGNNYVVTNADSLEPVGEPSAQRMTEVYLPDESQVFTGSSDESINVYDARTLLPGTSMQLVTTPGSLVYTHQAVRDAAVVFGVTDPSLARIWDGLSGRHVMDLSAAGSNIPNVCVDERAHRLFLMSGGVGTAFQVRAPGAGVDGQPATATGGAIMDFIAPGAQIVNSFELNQTGDEIAVFEHHESNESRRWQVRRTSLATRETLATWSFCILHSTEPVTRGARRLGLTWAGDSDMLYLGTSMPNGLFRLSDDGFEVLDQTPSPSLRVAPSAIQDNVAEFQLPEVVQIDCEYFRIAVECFVPRAMDVEHENFTIELQTAQGAIIASATNRHLSERGWYLLELDIVQRDHLSSPVQLTCRLQSDELALSESSEDAKASIVIGDVLIFPQTTGNIHNYTIGPLAGLADGTLAAISPEPIIQFWERSSVQPLDHWSDTPNESPGLRAIASSMDRVLVGTRFGNAFILQKGVPDWRVLGNVIDEGVENGRAISSVELSQDGQLALVGRKDGSVDALDLSERPHRDLNSGIQMKNEISAIAVSRDRTILAIGDRDGKLKFWQIDGDSFRECFQLSSLRSPVRKMRFSPDGRDLFILCDDERAVRILHLNTLESEFKGLGIQPIADHTR